MCLKRTTYILFEMSSFNFVLHKDYLVNGTEIFSKMLLLCYDFSIFRSGSFVTQLRNEVHILMRKNYKQRFTYNPDFLYSKEQWALCMMTSLA